VRAIVTGAARGIGAAVAGRIASDGGPVALVDVDDAVRATAERIGGDDASVVSIVVDVTDEAQVERGVADAVSSLGGLDLLVNNAGVGGPSTDLVDTPTEALRHVLDVNLVGAMIVARACARRMIAQRSGGTIVNIGSIFGQRGVAGGAAYCASKGGVALLTHSMALELAPHGIRVNTVAPGNMATEMHWADLRERAVTEGTTFEEQVERVRASIPLGRHGTGEDVASVVVWLASEDASYVTGQTLGVNGGVILT
jgi:NAD(P)-dependent dehydrogenase (short-subunit alcohol dehydrogenase family)